MINNDPTPERAQPMERVKPTGAQWRASTSVLDAIKKGRMRELIHENQRLRRELAKLAPSEPVSPRPQAKAALELLADISHLWIDGYIAKNPNSEADDSISASTFDRVFALLEANGITVDYCGWQYSDAVAESPLPIQEPQTNRQAHEEAAGMGLCEEFFVFNGIDPDAPYAAAPELPVRPEAALPPSSSYEPTIAGECARLLAMYNAEELQTIANRILLKPSNPAPRPHEEQP